MKPKFRIVPTTSKGIYRLYSRNKGWFRSKWCYLAVGEVEELAQMVQHLTKPSLYYDAKGRRIKGE